MKPAPMTPTFTVLTLLPPGIAVSSSRSSLLLGLDHLRRQALVVHGLPRRRQVLRRDRQGVDGDVRRRLLVEQAVAGERRLGHALVERTLSAQALDRAALRHVDRDILAEVDRRDVE